MPVLDSYSRAALVDPAHTILDACVILATVSGRFICSLSLEAGMKLV